MLVLTRKPSQQINVGNGIVVKVLRTARGSVKLGIQAPAHVRVLRGELGDFRDFTAAPESDGEELDALPELGDQFPVLSR